MPNVFPCRTPISVTMNNPVTTGNAVKRITNLRSTGFLTAQMRRRAQPVISVPATPITSLSCISGLKLASPVSMPNTWGENNPIAQSASAAIPSQYASLIKNQFLFCSFIMVSNRFWPQVNSAHFGKVRTSHRPLERVERVINRDYYINLWASTPKVLTKHSLSQHRP